MKSSLKENWLARYHNKEIIGRKDFLIYGTLFPLLVGSIGLGFVFLFLASDIWIIGVLFAIFAIYLSWSATFKRLRDIGKSEMWILLILVPYVDIVFWFYLLLKESKNSEERKMSWLKQHKSEVKFYATRSMQWVIFLGFAIAILDEVTSYSFETGKAFFYLAVIIFTAWWYKSTNK